MPLSVCKNSLLEETGSRKKNIFAEEAAMAILWSFHLTPTINTHSNKFGSSHVPVIFEVMLIIDPTLGVEFFCSNHP